MDPLFVAMLALFACLVEGGVLAWQQLRHKRAWAPIDWVPNLAAGVALIAALLLALHGAGDTQILACLAAAGLAHGLDLWARISRRPRNR